MGVVSGGGLGSVSGTMVIPKGTVCGRTTPLTRGLEVQHLSRLTLNGSGMTYGATGSSEHTITHQEFSKCLFLRISESVPRRRCVCVSPSHRLGPGVERRENLDPLQRFGPVYTLDPGNHLDSEQVAPRSTEVGENRGFRGLLCE